MANSAFIAVRTVSGSTLEIDSTGGTTPVISIDPEYPGQTSFTELGTIVIGEWEATPVGLQWGGTNAILTPSNGGILYSTASAGAILSGTSTADQVLLSGASSAPSWSTATYPASTTINQLLYSSAANTITGLATANNGVLITSSGGVPSIGTTLPTGVQTNITELGTITVGTWNGTTLAIAYGGTNATTASTALSNLGGVPLAGGTMTGYLILNADPTNALGAVTKEYADAISQGLTFKDSCYAASTANLNATYANGVSGIGATLTNAGSLAAFSIDGTSPTANARILVKNQSTSYQNGIYGLTTVGSGAVAWILTRTSDYDTSSEIAPGDFVLVDNGTVNSNTAWVETATVNTLGSDAITFSQFGNTGTVTSVSGTSGQIDVANGTSTPVISIDSGYIGQNSLTTLGTISSGTWNGSIITGTYGGTGVNNGSHTITLGGNLTTSGAFNSIFTMTASTSVTFPTSGTLATTSQLPSVAALTAANDTNVTLTLGGTPSTALLQASSITAGWTGTLSLARGGTAANLTASNGGILYSTASGGAILSGTSTADQVLLSGASSAPSWSTATYPASTTINQLLYSSAANTITGLATANNGVLITSSGGVPSIGTTLPTGVQTNITELGTVTVGTWNGTGVGVGYGGTGNSTFTAYSVLCGGTTPTGAFQNVSGVGTSGQVLTSNGASALPTWQAAGGGSGALIYITSATASSSASIAFTSLFNSTYDYYYFTFTGVLPATNDVNFQYTLSTDGSTYTSSGYQYGYYLNATAIGGGSGPTGSNTASTCILTSTTSNYQVSNIAANGGVSGTLILCNPNSSTLGTLGYHSLSYGSFTSGYYIASTNGFSGLSAQANTAIKFSFSSGNIASGTIRVYGVVET